MERTIRYQGAILRNHHLLLIKHQEHATGTAYWILPGGKQEPHETEEACVRREMLEETQLEVIIDRLILDEVGIPLGTYKRLKTYLCRVASGEAQPGCEPEAEAAQVYAISEVKWFDLRNPNEWEAQLESSPITLSLVHRIRTILGYSTEIPSATAGKTA